MEVLPAFELERRLAYLDTMIAELAAGEFRRTTFEPWEIQVLLDIQSCEAEDVNKKEMLRRYQRAAHRWFDRGGRTVLLLSDYLARRHRRAPVNGALAPDSAPLEDEPDELS
ncbi:MAG: hypothetical protein ABSC08_12795 [Bryobacteraceae bacterium]|jgi:hypothetical protein